MTAVEQIVRPGPPQEDPSVAPSIAKMSLPPGTVASTILSVGTKRDYVGSAGEGGRTIISHDFHLLVLGERVPRTLPEYVELYVVRANGSVVRHRPVSEEFPLLFHKPMSVFQVLGPGNVLRVRIFANAKNTPGKWPKKHKKVSEVPGMVLVLVRGKKGESTVRYVFFSPPELDHIWATDAEKAPRQWPHH